MTFQVESTPTHQNTSLTQCRLIVLLARVLLVDSQVTIYDPNVNK